MNETGLQTRDGQTVPLRAVAVRAEVMGSHARVVVRQRYQNTLATAVEAIYVFPLPSDAAVTGFRMTVGDRATEGVVKEREEAFRAYDEAILQGHGAAMMEQERANVFTATVGNLLPGEETVIEVEYLQKTRVDDGALRWSLPTLVAPRYIPGGAGGDRTGHGTQEPTARVPDADRVSPPVGDARYGLSVEVVFELGAGVEVEGVSHPVTVSREGERVTARLAQPDVALDRDVVILARGAASGPVCSVATHRAGDGLGYLSVSLLPEIAAMQRSAPTLDVVFVIDTSGSMEGVSMEQAKTALRLCLRHLRQGDRFGVIEFNSSHSAMAPKLAAFSQESLDRADAWIAALQANGGTELLAPMLDAVSMAAGGVVVLLTDGQVGNEAEILKAVTKSAKGARVSSFAIGYAASDALLRDMAKATGGMMETIVPGEAIDEKVVSQFSRIGAPRISDVTVTFHGVEVDDVSPMKASDIVDGEPWSVVARYAKPGEGRVEIQGRAGAEVFRTEVPLRLPEREDHPMVATVWADARIRELVAMEVTDARKSAAMKARIVAISVEHQVVSPYTAFVLVERREGARRATALPTTVAVPVHEKAKGDAMRDARVSAGGRNVNRTSSTGAPKAKRAAPPAAAKMTLSARMPPPAPPPPPPRAEPVVAAPSMAGPMRGYAAPQEVDALMPQESVFAASAGIRADMMDDFGMVEREEAPKKAEETDERSRRARKEAPPPVASRMTAQLASGLWDDATLGADGDLRRLRATRDVLRAMLDEDVDAMHPQHGQAVRKAITAVLAALPAAITGDLALARELVRLAWLLGRGTRLRGAARATALGAGALADVAAQLDDESVVRESLRRGA